MASMQPPLRSPAHSPHHVFLLKSKSDLAEKFLIFLLTNPAASGNIYLALRQDSQTRQIFGGIAQLGERLNGIQEVSGSIPLISTKKKDMTVGHVFLFGFRSRCSTPRYFKCSGQVNCPSAKVFAAGENACTAQSAAGQKAGLSPLCIAFHLNFNRTSSPGLRFGFGCKTGGWNRSCYETPKRAAAKYGFQVKRENFIYEKSEREPPQRRFSLTFSLALFFHRGEWPPNFMLLT